MNGALPCAVMALAALVGCTHAACGASDEAGPNPDERADTALALLAEPWCEPFAEAVCDQAAACGCTVSPVWPTDPTVCRSTARAQCMRDLRRDAELLELDFLVSPEDAPRCLALLEEAMTRCGAPASDLFAAECRLVTPRLGRSLPRAGDPCTSVCSPGLRCASDGRCRVPRLEDQPCRTDGDCADPFACRNVCPSGGACATLCTTLEAELGRACGTLSGRFCDDGAFCQTDQRFRCVPLAEGACAADHDCPEDSTCADFGSPQCRPLPRLGEICRDTLRCARGFACDFATLSCVEPADPGEGCIDPTLGGPGCVEGFVCRDLACQRPGDLGESCGGTSTHCKDGLVCIATPDGFAACAEPLALGDACVSKEACGPDAFCDPSGVCARLGDAGESCRAVNCRPGLTCVSEIPGEPRCAVVAKAGDTCADRCPPGLRCDLPAQDSQCVPPMCGLLRF